MIVDSLLVLPDYNDKTPALRLFYYSPTVEQQIRISAHYNDAPAAFEARDRTGRCFILLHWHNITYPCIHTCNTHTRRYASSFIIYDNI